MFGILLLCYFIIAAVVVAWVISMLRSYNDFHFHSRNQPIPSRVHLKH